MIWFENDAAMLYYFSDRKFAVSKWKGFAPTADLRDFLDKCTELVKEKEVFYWMGDNRQLKVIRPDDQKFMIEQWFPVFAKVSKIKKAATLQSQDVFGKVSVLNVIRAADKIIPFENKFFGSFTEAISWLGVPLTEDEISRNEALQ